LENKYRIASGYIALCGVRLHARHGVLPQERVTGGEFIVDLKVKCPLARAAETDDVADTLNYAELYRIINKEMQTPSCLLEHVAGRIGESILKAFPQVRMAEIEITKCNPPMGADCEGAAVKLRVKR
jgi:dihydroneopterin aldolase